MQNTQGKFIVLYGINNLGKTTQAKMLVDRLRAAGAKAEYIKYPIYDLVPSGVVLNNYLRGGNFLNLSPREAQIFYANNRTQYEKTLIAKLRSGINIIAEDYTGTGIAWGIGAGVDELFLKYINSHLLKEDLAFLFDGERFKEATETGHKHETDDELVSKVRQSHLKLGAENGWIKINANLSIKEIHEQLWDKVVNLIGPLPLLSKEGLGEVSRQTEKGLNNSFSAYYQTSPHPSPRIQFGASSCQGEGVARQTHKSKLQLKIQRVSRTAKLPTRARQGDAGLDLYSDDNYTLFPGDITGIKTGIKMRIPEGYVGLIWDKSGLAKQGIHAVGGVIDSGYRGEIIVLAKNLSNDIFNISKGQKIAQILIQKIETPVIVEDEINDETERGANGFGSSGIF
jgi:dUTP pyrophosphatase